MQRLDRIDQLFRLARRRWFGGGARGYREQRQIIGDRLLGLAADPRAGFAGGGRTPRGSAPPPQGGGTAGAQVGRRPRGGNTAGRRGRSGGAPPPRTGRSPPAAKSALSDAGRWFSPPCSGR